jgi:hypothetical protein
VVTVTETEFNTIWHFLSRARDQLTHEANKQQIELVLTWLRRVLEVEYGQIKEQSGADDAFAIYPERFG